MSASLSLTSLMTRSLAQVPKAPEPRTLLTRKNSSSAFGRLNSSCFWSDMVVSKTAMVFGVVCQDSWVDLGDSNLSRIYIVWYAIVLLGHLIWLMGDSILEMISYILDSFHSMANLDLQNIFITNHHPQIKRVARWSIEALMHPNSSGSTSESTRYAHN